MISLYVLSAFLFLSQSPIVEREIFDDLRTCWQQTCSSEQQTRINEIWARCANAEELKSLRANQRRSLDEALGLLRLTRAPLRLIEIRNAEASPKKLAQGFQTLRGALVFVRNGSIAEPTIALDQSTHAHEVRARWKPTVVAACGAAPPPTQDAQVQAIWAVEALAYDYPVSLTSELFEFFAIHRPLIK